MTGTAANCSLIRSPRRYGRAASAAHPEGFVERDLWNVRVDQSALAPENLTTFAHFSVSSAICFAKSAGDPPSTVSPRSAIRALISRSASTALISLLSLSMISAGEFLGAPMPYQLLAS